MSFSDLKYLKLNKNYIAVFKIRVKLKKVELKVLYVLF